MREMKDYRIGQAICDQIRAASGSVKIFNLIKNSFTAPPHIYFMKEQFSLYMWRKQFFLSHFPEGSWTTDCNFGCGKTGFGPEAHNMAAIHFNITENFDHVLKLAFSDCKPDPLTFPTDYFSPWFHNKFEWNMADEQDVLQKLSTLEFSVAVHTICVLYGSSPPSLLQTAMRRVLELGMSLDNIPREVQIKATRGLYYRVGREAYDGLEQVEWPRCISEEGERMLNRLIRQ